MALLITRVPRLRLSLTFTTGLSSGIFTLLIESAG